ncbi:hypothetical protein CAPTEDRAFT_156845 [Capitella teleta]|uniref:RRM domain-containing protein n=1 Tax=Capitella teleta TaxID=283909 RepID=R7TFE2_CAPTE|nr:hypothetical protein CAPTEDRAFT_156845 [Capitella teleta]|eukprot:ELT89736.1 hypothetical protein CAPTEDRAFT_156845 [Capitella teleta]
MPSRSRSKERSRRDGKGRKSSSSSSGSRSRSRSNSSSSSSSSSSGSSSSSRSSSGSSRRNSPVAKRRSRTRSRSPKRSRPRRSPTPRSCKVHVARLTRNVNKEHVTEIFSVYGTVKHVEMLVDRFHPEFCRGFAYVEYENADDAEKAVKHMDGGQIDGQEVTAATVLTQRPVRPPMRRSPAPPGAPPGAPGPRGALGLPDVAESADPAQAHLASGIHIVHALLCFSAGSFFCPAVRLSVIFFPLIICNVYILCVFKN